ncbi:MAG: acetyl-CoA carboxylase biotin carboxylase subunit [Clostridiales bacterium]|jgi:acetyl-CoA carboxylase biotin carboxylase subunit|nr:acetyl-CoA carboxylase biotin carboxylase subunit [Clostridiales bacterium]
MFNKILIANRGEIAVRIIRACKEMGVKTVAVYSDKDKNSLHTLLADEAVCIGPHKASDSYLNMYNIISAACLTKSQAIHPGFGFLAENFVFAAMCKECNIKFIGPSAETIEMMGDKSKARKIMIDSGVRVIPGSENIIESLDTAYNIANEYKYPIIIKASAGGGGKGIRIVRREQDLEQSFYQSKQEAKASFGDGSVYIEKFIEGARHIEVQILADEHNNIIHLCERDCSLQRRNQKVLEEAPSPAISDEKRRLLGEEAIKAAKACNYENAGTVEFLYDINGNFYFMEMNTRIQVEHPVTEMATNIDIVKEQLKIASGERLLISQKDIALHGHAIECRINAENPEKNFAPSPGKISFLSLPYGCLGLRVDSFVYQGYSILPYYDSMIAKVITHGKDRNEAIEKMKRALSEFVIEGIDTNIDFQINILNNENFKKGNVDTSFLENNLASLKAPVLG